MRRVTPPGTLALSPPRTEQTASRPLPDAHPPNSDDASPPRQSSATIVEHNEGKGDVPDEEPPSAAALLSKSPPHAALNGTSLWHWARAGTLLGKLPHPHVPLRPTRSLTSHPSLPPAQGDPSPHAHANPAPHPSNTAPSPNTNVSNTATPKDDFAIPSAVATDPENPTQVAALAAAKMEGLGFANRSVEGRAGWVQTKRSSDELVATAGGTPSPSGSGSGAGGAAREEEPGTPSPAPRKGRGSDGGRNGMVPRAEEEGEGKGKGEGERERSVPKYKIALVPGVVGARGGGVEVT